MPRAHAPFCVLHPDRIGHGLYCVSRPIALQAVAFNEQGKSVDITVDLAALWSSLDAPRMIRVIGEPPSIEDQFLAVMATATERQLAAALLIAAGQAEELERGLSRPRPSR